MNKYKNIETTGAKVALIYGSIFGFGLTLFLFILGLLLADGLLGLIGLGALMTYNDIFISFVLLLVSFPFALWFFGKNNAKSLKKGKSILKTSFEFSFGVNVLIWLVFLLSQIIFSGFEYSIELNLIVLVIILVLGLLTTGTLGLFIVKQTEKKINN